jgi:Tfp pilus assembly protein PilX
MMQAFPQRGVALLIAVVIILVVAVFGVLVAGSISSGDIVDSHEQRNSVEALFAAESGLERALKEFGSGTACAALNALPVTFVTGKTFTVSTFTTGFGGAALSSSQCRVQVVGAVTATGVTRTIQALLDRNLVGGAGVNADFNLPSDTTNTPTAWTGGVYDFTGGPDTRTGPTPPDCTRSAFAVKARTGGTDGTAAGNLNPNFTVPAGTVLRISFDYRVVGLQNGSAACTTTGSGGACPGTKDASSPGAGAGSVEYCFNMSNGTTTWNSTYLAVDKANDGKVIPDYAALTSPTCTRPTQNASFALCTTHYDNNAYPTKGSVTVTVGTAGGADITLNSLGYNINVKSGQPHAAWVDNIVITGTGAVATAMIKEWRDCSATACT